MTQDAIHVQIDKVRKVYHTRRDAIEAIRSVSMQVRNGEFVEINLPRPRELAIEETPAFNVYVTELRQSIEGHTGQPEVTK